MSTHDPPKRLLTLQEGNLWHLGNTGRHLSRTAQPFLTCLFGHDASGTACGQQPVPPCSCRQDHGHVTRRKPAWSRVTWTNGTPPSRESPQRTSPLSDDDALGEHASLGRTREQRKQGPYRKRRKNNNKIKRSQGVKFCAYN
ncbi:uncharacterized protein GLRG_03403 [Colletotrichum graminicola M1.001]|uniref:Uncharacterized protein n=1 Tax=Colletotrichum graminicola (strain M1.001 / M2 / FGSC 10212) TaxID=645133 RepID=E3QC24_COLGM|nr:uncharacterized protein GLRG_03403 [Colletotrichum graminicola M1.001]EFQ28259.1 hypothetical protein GLRG_03403 [Colletotrichum graminicola M1.001]